ncbi:UbiA prenyltransferase [Mycena vitilis]|nr:UbiA prenyltransferase [Mycena vitilis]
MPTPPALFPTIASKSSRRTEELRACWELCRLHKNIGFWVVWLPTGTSHSHSTSPSPHCLLRSCAELCFPAWSIAMAYTAHPDISLAQAVRRAVEYVPLCLGTKSLIMTIDDILDHDVDALVERTHARPIPRGAISLRRAWLFFALQVCVGVCCAVRCLSSTALYVAAAAFPLYIIYPTCKRWTNLAPIPLGLMFNVGVFMGWADVAAGSVPWGTLAPVYVGACFWTMVYETVYQHQDKADDIALALHSPALLLGPRTLPLCTLFSLFFLALVASGGALNAPGTPFLLYAGLVLGGALLLAKLWDTDIDRPEACRRFFLGTPRVGQVVLAGFVVDAVYTRLRNGVPL